MVSNLLVYGNDDRIAAQNKRVRHQDKFQVSNEIDSVFSQCLYQTCLQFLHDKVNTDENLSKCFLSKS